MSLHRLATPTYTQILGSLDSILEKARLHCLERKLDEGVLLTFRFFPDMYPFVRQVQCAADCAAGSCLRLALREVAHPPLDEISFSALRQRVAAALAKVQSVAGAEMDANAQSELTIPLGSREVKMRGWDYMVHLALPNFYFHATTAYDILRHNGVDLGKRDFLGIVPGLPRG